MNRLFAAIGILSIAFLISGCGVASRTARPASAASDSTVESRAKAKEEENPRIMKVSSVNEIQASLMQAYRDWKGTPYVLGGESKSGVDCSRFLEIIFDDYFGIDMPNNTREQLNTGSGIRRAGIRAGDLVFFKTGRKTLHVGVAVNSGEFLHASTSSGVRISKLGNSYWRERFLAARRVF